MKKSWIALTINKNLNLLLFYVWHGGVCLSYQHLGRRGRWIFVGRKRQVDLREFEDSLMFKVSFSIVRTIQRPCLTKQRNKQTSK